jgi:osmotically-inducible protein OsmY
MLVGSRRRDQMRVNTVELERLIEEEAGVHAAVQLAEGTVTITAMVNTAGEHQAALDIANQHLENERLVDNIEVTSVVPEEIGDLDLSVEDVGGFQGVAEGTEDDEALEPGDFMDQEILENAEGAAGPTSIADIDQEISEGEESYVPPVDPPSDGADEIIGGFQTTSMDPEEAVDTGGRSDLITASPDELIRDRVLHELREDAATTNLQIEVEVASGVVRLRGTVDDIEDAENAEEVATRVEGVEEVSEELKLRNG